MTYEKQGVFDEDSKRNAKLSRDEVKFRQTNTSTLLWEKIIQELSFFMVPATSDMTSTGMSLN